MPKNPWDDINFGDNPKKEPLREKKPNTPNNKNSNYEFKEFQKIFKRSLGFNDDKYSNKTILMIVIGAILLYLLSGIFTIAPEQEGIITRFGKYNRTIGPGLHYRIPYPVENLFKETVTRVRTLKIGIDSANIDNNFKIDTTSKSLYLAVSDGKNRLQEGLILTGDENIIDMHFEIQWKIKDLKDYVFRVKDPIKTITDVSQSVIREVVAQNTLADIITKGRAIIESSTAESLQNILDEYNSGVSIIAVQMLRADPPLPVIDAFRDVQTARVNKESEINLAESYKNDITPKARGNAQKVLQDAEAYSTETITKAEGQVSRFNSVYEQYKNAKYITRKRIYIETLEEIFNGMDKIIIDDQAKGVIPYLPLDFQKKTDFEMKLTE